MSTTLRAGPHNPLLSTPPLPAHSARRTWSIDIAFPDGLAGGIVADVRGRDVRVDAGEQTNVVDELSVTLDIEQATNTITGVEVKKSSVPLDALVGVSARGGFGRTLAELLPSEHERRALLYSALEDLSGARLVSGFAHLTEGLIPQSQEYADLAAAGQSDICIGWAADGAFITTARAEGRIPAPVGPLAPNIDAGWHAMPQLTAPTVRRRRRVDVHFADRFRAQEHFRDSYAGFDSETVMHEYLVDADFDGGRLASITVEARVLPWHECPGATASAQQLVGTELEDIADRVRRDLKGITTCTHLNSTLRTLADVRSLAVVSPPTA